MIIVKAAAEDKFLRMRNNIETTPVVSFSILSIISA